MKQMRCVVHEIGVVVRASEYSERIGDGKIVDFHRVLIPAGKGPAYTLGDALAGRHDCFVEVIDEANAFQRNEPATPDEE